MSIDFPDPQRKCMRLQKDRDLRWLREGACFSFEADRVLETFVYGLVSQTAVRDIVSSLLGTRCEKKSAWSPTDEQAEMQAQRYDQYPWYHGKLDRHRAEDILRNKRTGTYLVRDSNTIPGDYVLSVRENASLGALYSHYIINRRGNLYIIGDQTFSSLPEVIEFYHDHYLDTTVLTDIAEQHASGGGGGVVQPRGRPGEQNPPPVTIPPPSPQPQAQVPQHVGNNGAEHGTVKALFKFQSDDPEDLEFEKDDIMIIISKDEEAWWTARHTVSGKQGSIPVPYVEVISGGARQDEPPRAAAQPEPGRQHGAAARNPSTSSAQPDTPGRAGGRPVKALAILDRYASAYDNTALSFKAGETITVIRQNENGLWEGELNGKQGHFPFTHVQVIDDGDPASFSY